ncbi:MAG TPA: DUF4386 domain-containing protein [Rhodanobacteraceae bacterium]|jgi:hypothetical protein|nr:DUF4386 domain-containing protein [Rhodanobacteraceae bacterium]
MNPLNRKARIAGLLFLLLVLTAPIRLVYVPATLFVSDNASATVANIVANETLFRTGIFADLLAGILTLFLTLALYRLFADVDRRLAVLVVILGGIFPTAIYFFNVLNDAAVLLIARGPAFLSVFEKPQRDAAAMLFLRLHGQEIGAAMVFWGLWLLPLAVLILRSGFLPRILGWLLILNGFAYLAQSVTWSLLPQVDDVVTRIATPLQFAEVLFMLWLLIMGARPGFRRRPDPRTITTGP